LYIYLLNIRPNESDEQASRCFYFLNILKPSELDIVHYETAKIQLPKKQSTRLEWKIRLHFFLKTKIRQSPLGPEEGGWKGWEYI
jgi:hypothetical protein